MLARVRKRSWRFQEADVGIIEEFNCKATSTWSTHRQLGLHHRARGHSDKRDLRLMRSVILQKILSGRSQLVHPLAVQNCKDQWEGENFHNKSIESLLISRKKFGNIRKGSCAPCLESASWTPSWYDGPCGSKEANCFRMRPFL